MWINPKSIFRKRHGKTVRVRTYLAIRYVATGRGINRRRMTTHSAANDASTSRSSQHARTFNLSSFMLGCKGGQNERKFVGVCANHLADSQASPLARLFRERCETTEQSRDELGDRRMDVHGALQDGVGRLGVHGVEHAMDGFVTARAQERRPQNLLRLRVDEHLHEAVGLALLEGARDILHGNLADQRATAAS